MMPSMGGSSSGGGGGGGDDSRGGDDHRHGRKASCSTTSAGSSSGHHGKKEGRRWVVRIQKQDDLMTRRIEIQEQMSTGKFYKKVIHAFHLHNPKEYGVYRGRNKTILIKPSGGKTLASYKIKNGDMLFLFPHEEDWGDEWEAEDEEDGGGAGTPLSPQDSVFSPGPGGDTRFFNSTSRSQSQQNVIYEEEDLGVEAPDLTFETATERNYMPFNDYLSYLCRKEPNNPFPLEPIKFSLLIGCSQHEIYPNNKCSKCNPSLIGVDKQIYRHVDNLMFENQFIVERFVRAWRKTGNQRMGYMYGSYREHEIIQNGVRAVVSAIYEPPQSTTEQNIELLEDTKDNQVQSLARQLGLQKIGWIFTDLLTERENVIKCTRDKGEGSKLSSEECIMAGELQNKNPKFCDKSRSGTYGSQFVTVCVTGDTSNQIHFEALMVSDQCAALVKEELISAVPESPELIWISEASEQKPIPPLYFETVGQDGVHRKYNARPLPVDQILVSVPAEFPLRQEFTFKVHDRKPFPIENREHMNEVQDLETLNKYLCQFTQDEFLMAISDFHLLIYLTSLDIIPLWSNMGALLECIREQNEAQAVEWVSKSQHWSNLLDLINGGALENYVSAESERPEVEFAELAIQTSNLTLDNYRRDEPHVN